MVRTEFWRLEEQIGSAALRITSIYSQFVMAAWVTPKDLGRPQPTQKGSETIQTTRGDGTIDKVGI